MPSRVQGSGTGRINVNMRQLYQRDATQSGDREGKKRERQGGTWVCVSGNTSEQQQTQLGYFLQLFPPRQGL